MFLRSVVIRPINAMCFRRCAALFMLRLLYISVSDFVVY